MSHMRYNRVGSKKSSSYSCHGFRGFRINPRRFSVQKLRTKFLYLLKIFNKWRSSYGNAFQSMRKNPARRSRKDVVVTKEVKPYKIYSMDDSRIRSFARTNSFYSEAIADCLDFIKRNSLSMDENPMIKQT
ncbi:hypothetical protein ACH5RR_013510 [Cinchona calisaya]|uniref:Uncharacterized protein n=1 Tax=Cinchona calisaya TaxID=153742 RepID=A0ABD3A600_9GENT